MIFLYRRNLNIMPYRFKKFIGCNFSVNQMKFLKKKLLLYSPTCCKGLLFLFIIPTDAILFIFYFVKQQSNSTILKIMAGKLPGYYFI